MRRLLAFAVFGWATLLLALPRVCSANPDPSLTAGLMRYALDTERPWLALAYAPKSPTGHILFLRGEAYRRLGMDARARQDMLRVVGAGDNADTAKAEMLLGFIDASGGKTDSASDHLRRALGGLKGTSLQHASFELAELDRQSGHLDLAAQRLSSMAQGIWAAFGYLDLATAYAKLDSDPSRTLVSLRVAAAMLDGNQTAAGADLLDRINLTAADVAFHASQFSKSLNFLNKIRIDGYYAPSALYLHGLAQARQDNYRAAMQFWHRARKYPLAFPGVPEASMGMGLAFDEAGYLGEAGDAYLGASSAFEKELVNLKSLVESVRKKGAWQALMVASQNDNVEWFLANTKSLTTPRMAYLSRLMESGSAQHAAMRVSRLHQLARQLDREDHDLSVFAAMLQDRIAKVRQSRSSGKLARLRSRSAKLKALQSRLAKRLADATQGGDVEALVSGRLGHQFEQVDNLMQKAKRSGASPEIRTRLQRLRGLLIWRAQEQARRNARAISADFHQASAELQRVDAAILSFNDKMIAAPVKFRSLLKRVRQQQAAVKSTQAALNGLLARAEKDFDGITLTFLTQQEQRMRAWRDRGNQEVAHLYEYLALTQKQRKDAQGKSDSGLGGQP